MALTLRDWLARCPLIAILRGVRPEEAEAVTRGAGGARHRHRRGAAELARPAGQHRPPGRPLRRAAADRGGHGDERGGGRRGGRGRRAADRDPARRRGRGARGEAARHGRLPGHVHADRGVRDARRRRGRDQAVPGRGIQPGGAAGAARGAAGGTLVLPVGGIDAATMRPWREAGAAGFGVGSSIYRPGDTPAQVGAKAAALTAALRA